MKFSAIEFNVYGFAASNLSSNTTTHIMDALKYHRIIWCSLAPSRKFRSQHYRYFHRNAALLESNPLNNKHNAVIMADQYNLVLFWLLPIYMYRIGELIFTSLYTLVFAVRQGMRKCLPHPKKGHFTFFIDCYPIGVIRIIH